MNAELQQSATDVLSKSVGAASAFTASAWVTTLLGWLTPVVGFAATVLGICFMIYLNKKKYKIMEKESLLLDLQIAEHRKREDEEQ